jgi:hypothetical protein
MRPTPTTGQTGTRLQFDGGNTPLLIERNERGKVRHSESGIGSQGRIEASPAIVILNVSEGRRGSHRARPRLLVGFFRYLGNVQTKLLASESNSGAFAR